MEKKRKIRERTNLCIPVTRPILRIYVALFRRPFCINKVNEYEQPCRDSQYPFLHSAIFELSEDDWQNWEKWKKKRINKSESVRYALWTFRLVALKEWLGAESIAREQWCFHRIRGCVYVHKEKGRWFSTYARFR